MTPPGADSLTHPEPQRYYKMNLAALTWRELWRLNAVSLPVIAPLIAVCKVFGISLAFGPALPREISLMPAGDARPEKRAASLRDGLQALGFEHFTTYRIPEFPGRVLVLGLMHRQENAYADVVTQSLFPVKKTYCAIYSCFRQGGTLTTLDWRRGDALDRPLHRPSQVVHRGSPKQLLAAHRRRLSELGVVAAEVSPVSSYGHASNMHQWGREMADLQESRGFLVPQVGP